MNGEHVKTTINVANVLVPRLGRKQLNDATIAFCYYVLQLTYALYTFCTYITYFIIKRCTWEKKELMKPNEMSFCNLPLYEWKGKR